VARTPLNADEYLCRAAEIERPVGWTRRRGTRIRRAVESALDEGRTDEETQAIAMSAVGMWLLAWLGRAVLSELVRWVIRKIRLGRASGAIRND
jgi:hypothetical protein